MQESRKHHDTLLPNQKSPVPLNRFRPHGLFCAFLSTPFPQVRGRELAGQRGNLLERGQETGRLQNGCPRHLQLPGAEQQRALVQEGGRDLYQETGWTKNLLVGIMLVFRWTATGTRVRGTQCLESSPPPMLRLFLRMLSLVRCFNSSPSKIFLSHVLINLQCR